MIANDLNDKDRMAFINLQSALKIISPPNITLNQLLQQAASRIRELQEYQNEIGKRP